jgi:hypothetical protein
MFVEDTITALRQQRAERPFGWLICFEGRPLQGIPPRGNGPHLLFFSAEFKAQAFISDRKSFFGQEPLSIVAVDSAERLKSIALDVSSDSRYTPPPCGIVMDFDHASRKSRKVLAPVETDSLSPVEIARMFAGGASQAAVPGVPLTPVHRMETAPRAKQNRPLTIGLITCGALLLVGLFILCVAAVWFGMKRGMIPALPSFTKPAATEAPVVVPVLVPTAVPTNTPAIVLLPTPTTMLPEAPISWDETIVDDFSANAHGWPLGNDNGQYGSSAIAIRNGKLAWELKSVENCWYWWYPDLPAVADLDAAVDVQRTGGSTSGDYGMVVRADGDKGYFYYFAINDARQEYAFFVYQYENWTKIHDWTFANAIQTGQVNRIEVQATGSQFVFLVNGIVVGQADDTRLSSGKVGVLAQLYDAADKLDIEYDNLILRGNR